MRGLTAASIAASGARTKCAIREQTAEVTVRRGTDREKMEITFSRPWIAAKNRSTVNPSEPSHGLSPASCSIRAPAPAVMTEVTLNRNSSCSAVSSPRSAGAFRPSMSWPGVCPVCVKASLRRLKPAVQINSSATVRPAQPQAPNTPKNCRSSWPETYPAPRKQPAKVIPKRSGFKGFIGVFLSNL